MEVENYWNDNAAKLRAELAHKGEEFIVKATMEEIEQCNPDVFLGIGPNEKSAIVRTMRDQQKAEALPA